MEYGIPIEVISDNGPQYSSEAYNEFTRQYKFDHKVSSPRFLQKNAFVKRHIQTVEKLLELYLRATPINYS